MLWHPQLPVLSRLGLRVMHAGLLFAAQKALLETLLWKQPTRSLCIMFGWFCCCWCPAIIPAVPAFVAAFVLFQAAAELPPGDAEQVRR